MRLLILTSILGLLSMHCGQDSRQSSPTSKSPTPARSEAPTPGFDGTRAFKYLTTQTSFGPRNPNSAGHRNCLTFLQLELGTLADSIALQEFSQQGYGEVLSLTNIFARFNQASEYRILLVAHWDTRPRADNDPDPKKRNQPILGANDGASGVAVLLELARMMKANPPPNGVDLLLVDGEDYGHESDTRMYLLGARYFAANIPSGYSPQYGVLLDLVGDANLSLKKERYSLQYAPDVVEMIWSTASGLGIAQFSGELQNWVMDDHLPLNEAGIRTVNIIDFEYPDTSNRYWHSLDDTPDKCSPASLEAVGRVIAEIIYHPR